LGASDLRHLFIELNVPASLTARVLDPWPDGPSQGLLRLSLALPDLRHFAVVTHLMVRDHLAVRELSG
jgi:hypothetical protein